MKVPMLLAAALLMQIGIAHAQVRVTGVFTAKQACPATQAIRSASGAAAGAVEPGRTYQLVGKNKDQATFLQIVVDGAQRWVDISCGEVDAAAGPGNSASRPADAASGPSGVRATYVLALSWEPGFCRGHGDTEECRTMEAAGPAERLLTLHGLWPEPRGRAHCSVDPALVQADRAHAWNRLPEPEMSAATRQRLAAVMPGVQSGLQRHEWIEHGTCSGLTADAYFNRAAELAEQVRASAVAAGFAATIGGTLSADAIGAAFDRAFGAQAGARVTVACQGRGSVRRVVEIEIALAGDVVGSAPVADLIRAAAPVPPSCPGGLLDAPLRK